MHPSTIKVQHPGRRPSSARSLVAVLLTCFCCYCVSRATAGAGGPPNASPWTLYIEAAAETESMGDLAAAVALLNAANDLADAEGRESLRASITRLLLASTYAEANQMEQARAVPAIRINLGEVDASFLPVVNMLSRLADAYFVRWRQYPATPGTEEERARKEILLESVARFYLVESAFQQKLLPADDERTAVTLDHYGDVLMLQGKLDAAIAALEKASDIEDKISAKEDLFARTKEETTLFPDALSRQKSQAQIDIKLDLAYVYLLQGAQDQDEKNEKGAAERFAESERLIQEMLGQFGGLWLNHPRAGLLNRRLAEVYEEWKDKNHEAEPTYRRALAIYESANGPAHDQTRRVARELASFLRTSGKEEAAKEVEQRYGLTSQATP
jgi:tetratricopeptide (TPR) repeat protein